MSAHPKARTIAIVVSLAALLGAIALARPEMVGWFALMGFGTAGIAFLLGAGGIARRRTSVAFGVYMLVCAAKFGTEFGGRVVPRWFAFALTPLLLLAVAWFVFESRQDRHASARDA